MVVTCNRRTLLEGCLERLAAQSRAPDAIVVLDNASTDGTPDLVRSRYPSVDLVETGENLGSAGGFARAVDHAVARGFEWIWLMDDDTWPEPDALAALLAGAARAPERPDLLCSQVLWKDGHLHPMNEPWFAWRRAGELVDAVDRGLLQLRHATFVSLLVHHDAVARYGGPLAHYFVSTDDFEWTGRILRDGVGYLVPESRVVHFTPEAHSPVSGAKERFHWFVRNSLLLLRGPVLRPVERLQYGRMTVRFVRDYLVRHGWRDRAAWSVVWKGVRSGLRDPVA